MSATAHLTEAQLKKRDEAEAEVKRLSEVVVQKPNDYASWADLGRNNMVVGNIDEAIRCYKKSIEVNPQSLVSTYALGLLYEGLGNFIETKKYADICYSINSNDYKSNYLNARLLMREGKLEESLPYLQAMLKAYPTLYTPNYHLGNVYMAQGKKEEAVKHWETGSKSPWEDFDSCCYRGQCYSKLGKKTEAFEMFQKAKQEIDDGKTTTFTPIQVEYARKSIQAVLDAEDISKQADVEMEKAKKTLSTPVLRKLIERVKDLQTQQEAAQIKVIEKLDKPQSDEAKKDLNDLEKLKLQFQEELAKVNQALSQVQNQVTVIDKRVSNVEKGLDEVKEELDNKLDDFKKKLGKELDKQDLSAEDKDKIQGYFKAFLGTFSAAYVTAQVVDSGQVKLDAGNSATTILSTLASFAPFVGSVLESGITSVGEFLQSREMKVNARQLKGIATDANELSQVIGRVGYEITINKEQQNRIINTGEDDVDEVSENLFKKVMQFCKKMNEKVDGFLYSKLYKTPQERLGHNDANLLIEKWINTEITPFKMEEKLIKEIMKKIATTQEKGEAQEKKPSNTEEVKRSACCNVF